MDPLAQIIFAVLAGTALCIAAGGYADKQSGLLASNARDDEDDDDDDEDEKDEDDNGI